MHPINKNISETGTFIHVFRFFKEVIYFWENVLKVCSINSNYFWNDTMYILIKCNMLSEFEKKKNRNYIGHHSLLCKKTKQQQKNTMAQNENKTKMQRICDILNMSFAISSLIVCVYTKTIL